MIKKKLKVQKKVGIKTIGIGKELKADHIIKNLKELMKIIDH